MVNDLKNSKSEPDKLMYLSPVDKEKIQNKITFPGFWIVILVICILEWEKRVCMAY